MNVVMILLVFYLAFLITIYLMQDRMIYYPEREVVQKPLDIGVEHEEVTLQTNDNDHGKTRKRGAPVLSWKLREHITQIGIYQHFS